MFEKKEKYERHLKKISDALRKRLDMCKRDADAYARHILKKGVFAVFGYGSLIGDPTDDQAQRFPAFVEGWTRGAYCADTGLRGTLNNPGITQGALPVRDAFREAAIDGMVDILWTRKNAVTTEPELEKLLEAIAVFAGRETGPNPIYRYVAVKARNKILDKMAGRKKRGARNFETCKALICAADNKNPKFVGRAVGNPNLPDHLTPYEMAALVAIASGPQEHHKTRSTSLAYWRFSLSGLYQAGIEPPREMVEMVALANSIRAALVEDVRKGNIKSPKLIRMVKEAQRLDARAATQSEQAELDWRVSQPSEKPHHKNMKDAAIRVIMALDKFYPHIKGRLNAADNKYWGQESYKVSLPPRPLSTMPTNWAGVNS